MSLLADMRISHEWTQRELARRIGVSHMTYRRYEYGEEFPKHNALSALADLYNMLPGELFQLLIDGDVIGYPRQKELDAELDAYRKWRKRA